MMMWWCQKKSGPLPGELKKFPHGNEKGRGMRSHHRNFQEEEQKRNSPYSQKGKAGEIRWAFLLHDMMACGKKLI
jgi:hypothetical protein